MDKAPARAAQLAARESYGKLLALLSVRTHDIAQAEDALADAFTKALSHWPEHGVPNNPDAWLLTVAKNRLTDRQRHLAKFHFDGDVPELADTPEEETPLPDKRLSLLLVCTHPALPKDLHTPLMLQTVLGLEAKEIARLFLISPSALSQRLVRAKKKIRNAGIPFHIPEAELLAERASSILEAIYSLHALDWLEPKDSKGDEALYLADLMCRLLPNQPESLGLASLIGFAHARQYARIIDGTLVPIDTQDVSLWDSSLIAYGNRQLAKAASFSQPGRFQLEAAIESVHIARKSSGKVDWTALNRLYHGLIAVHPTAGSLVAQAVVTGKIHGAQTGLNALDQLTPSIGTAFQPYWAAKLIF